MTKLGGTRQINLNEYFTDVRKDLTELKTHIEKYFLKDQPQYHTNSLQLNKIFLNLNLVTYATIIFLLQIKNAKNTRT